MWVHREECVLSEHKHWRLFYKMFMSKATTPAEKLMGTPLAQRVGYLSRGILLYFCIFYDTIIAQ